MTARFLTRFTSVGLVVVGLTAPAFTTSTASTASAGSTATVSAVAVPADQAATSAAALAPRADGSQLVVYRGEDDAVYQRVFAGGTWSAQSSLGGVIVGAPAATSAGGTPVIAGRGTSGNLYLRTTQGWQNLGGILSAAPAMAGAADGRLDVFVRGANDQLYTRQRSAGGSWTAWSSLGGLLASGPAAVLLGSGRLDVYAVGTDHAVWRRSRTGGVWSGWTSLGGQTNTAPAAAATPGGVMVFVRGTNNGLYANSNATGWQPLGGALIDAPAASANSTGGVDVVVRGTDRALWTRAFRSGTWSASYQRAWAPSAPTPPPASRLGTDWTRIPTSSKVIALTFDAGGNDRGLASIRRTLQLKNVPATFFLTGAWTRSFPTRANEVAVAGFRVGNHTDTHPHLPALTTDAAVRAQINTAEEAILRGTGADPRPLFRFPFGDVNSRVLGIVNDEGYVAVRWTVDSLGWQGTSGGTVQQVVDRVLAGAQPGAIVLMHVGSNPDDGTTFDAAALPQIIDGFRARGYTFVTLNALVR